MAKTIDWEKRTKEPHPEDKVKVVKIVCYPDTAGFKVGDILILAHKRRMDSEYGQVWDTKKLNSSIYEQEFELC